MTLITNPLDEHQRTMKEIEIKRRPGMPIFENPVYKIPSPENQKHEKIEKKAWELYQKMQVLTDELFFKAKDNKDTRFKDFYSENNLPMMQIAWSRAEKFYDYAKEQEEASDG